MAKGKFVNVDAYQESRTLADAAGDCGIDIAIGGSGNNVRIDCPYSCDGDHAGKQEIAVDVRNPAKQWQCHGYGCGRRGNLLKLMYGWLEGTWPGDGKLRGKQFCKVRDRIAAVLARKTAHEPKKTTEPATSACKSPPDEEKPAHNTPLLRSDDPQTRSLMQPPIWEKFTTDIAAMQPAASSYVRRHRCLTPEAMAKWHIGVLPNDGGGDKRGFSLRGKIIYPILSEDNQTLGFVARDPKFEEKLAAFERIPPEERDPAKRPVKHRFPKGFKRGLELYGQQSDRLKEAGYREAIARYGIIVVEGFNDVIRLDREGIPAVAICSNLITDEQVTKLIRWSKMLKTHVSLMFDCDAEGDRGAADAAWKLLQAGVSVRPAWGRSMFAGRFADRQPESLAFDELTAVLSSVGKTNEKAGGFAG